MQRLLFQHNIKVSAQHAYEKMLGLKDISTYKHWTAEFNPTSTYEGNWDKGSKMRFIGVDENGKVSGMVSRILDNQPAQFVSIEHYGFVDGDTEITTGELVEKWTGGQENYSFAESNGVTTVSVEIDVVEEYLDYFNEKYPAALEKLREICER
ncbi:MAG: hypothetical protein RL660_2659 [Bacteroidota bacterium]|jgi:hypothetical protein